GTTLTEAAVARCLRWLSKHQNADGSWSLDRFNRSSGCTCSAPGIHSNSAGTSLALLPFLGAGQTHLVGHYRESVARGLRWLIAHQKQNGDLRADSAGNSGMYAQGQCAIVLCETFFMTGDEELRVPAQRAIDFIVDAQHGAGGWRYQPRQKGDTSVFGWQLMALQSARAANLTVPAETLTLASQYLDSVQSSDGALYAYQGSRGPDHVMTAEALLCRMYLGWTTSDAGLQRGMDYLANDHLPEDVAANIYYWYYATQALHHIGGSKWERWNRQMRSILVKKQKKRGHEAGSWDPQHSHDRGGGRLYATALATCTLEVYYRHLPIFRQIELE
ncbi:MAG: terpene cyclase/mutase family protein, partial [Pirellulaceae bacterium]|nr:terpene cyclase/mutase family protein [Pirellulaceae bacterium]